MQGTMQMLVGNNNWVVGWPTTPALGATVLDRGWNGYMDLTADDVINIER